MEQLNHLLQRHNNEFDKIRNEKEYQSYQLKELSKLEEDKL